MEGVEEIKHLKPGMILEGTVTNVAAFGAFVDIGVHQDGLVHISALADKFVKDPHTVVKVGQVVKVKVVEIDEKRTRIALTMRLADAGGERGQPKEQQRGQQKSRESRPEQRKGEKGQLPKPEHRHQQQQPKQQQKRKEEARPDTAMAAAFARLKG
jgi:uncharacterized protein